MLAPELEQRLVVVDLKVVAAGIAHTGDAHGVKGAEERARACELLFGCRARQQVKEVADGAVVTDEPAGRLAVFVALDG